MNDHVWYNVVCVGVETTKPSTYFLIPQTYMAECNYSNYYRPPRSLIKWKGRQQLISVTSLSKIKLKCPPVLSTQGSYITVLPASSKLLRSYYRLFCFENPF